MIFHQQEELIRYLIGDPNIVVGVTSGCFDLLHPLHVEYLIKCKRECDELYVLVDSDRLVQLNKNKTPLINELDRAYMVDSLKAVDGSLIINSLLELHNTIQEISFVANGVKVFKNSNTIYGKQNIAQDIPSVENIVIPDVIKYQSTTEITNFLKKES